VLPIEYLMTNNCIDIVNEPVDFDKNVNDILFFHMIVDLIFFYFYAMVL